MSAPQAPASAEDFRQRFEFAAPIDAVYAAIATPEGIRGW